MERALIIDSDATTIKSLSFFLQKMGIAVEKETDPGSILDKIEKIIREYDLIFIEQKLPGLNGTTILKKLQDSNCKSCVIFMGKTPDLRSVIHVLQEGAFSFLEKPIEYNQLNEVVQRGIENRKAFFQIISMSENLKQTNASLEKERSRLKKEKTMLKRINQDLNLLNQLSLKINATLDAHIMVETVARSMHHQPITYTMLTFFYLLNGGAFLKIYTTKAHPPNGEIDHLKKEVAFNFFRRTREKILSQEITTEVIKQKTSFREKPFRSGNEKIYLPLEVAGTTLGLMGLHGIPKLKKNHLRLLSTLVNHLALALKNAAEHQKAQELAITDELTGVFNRRAFQRILERELRRAKRYQKPLSLIMLDIDGFKEINDTYGHQAGDEVLKTLASSLKNAIRETDLIARYGGDEFAVILPETKAAEASVLAARLKNIVKNCTFTIEGTPYSITLSSGVSDISGNGTGTEELINQADQALYISKSQGGNVVNAVGAN